MWNSVFRINLVTYVTNTRYLDGVTMNPPNTTVTDAPKYALDQRRGSGSFRVVSQDAKSMFDFVSCAFLPMYFLTACGVSHGVLKLEIDNCGDGKPYEYALRELNHRELTPTKYVSCLFHRSSKSS